MKKIWGSQPGKERGAMHKSEAQYLRAVTKAHALGCAAAGDPKTTDADCPVSFGEDERQYWRMGLREVRRHGRPC